MSKVLYNNFVTGLINPTMTGRIESNEYMTGAEELTNVIVRPDGSLMKRNGFKIHLPQLGEVDDARTIQIAKSAKFYEVLFVSAGEAGRIEVYDNDTQELLATCSSPYRGDLQKLQVSSYMGDLYVTCKDNPPMMLVFDPKSNDVSITEVPFEQDTVVDRKDASTYPSSNLFYAGRWWIGGSAKTPFTVYGSMVSTSENGVAKTRFTDFTMKGQQSIESFFVQTVVKNKSGQTMKNETLRYNSEQITAIGYDTASFKEMESPSMFAFYFPDVEYVFEPETNALSAIVRVYYWKDSAGKLHVTKVSRDATDQNPQAPVTTDYTGYGASIRWVTAESFDKAKEQYIPDAWLTVSGEKQQSTMVLLYKSTSSASDVEDDNAISLTEADSLDNPIGIRWMFADKRMLVGFGKIVMMDSGAVPTPKSFDLKTTVQDGCGSVTPVGLGNFILYTGINDMSVRAVRYDYDTDGYLSTDISKNISLFIHEGGGVRQMTTQLVPFPIVWVLLNDGTLLACSFNPNSGLLAWSKVVLGVGKIRSVSIFNKYDSNELEYLEAVVQIGSSFFVETMELTLDGESFGKSQSGFSCYLDNSQTKKGQGAVSLEDVLQAVKDGGNVAVMMDDSYGGVMQEGVLYAYTGYARYGSPFTARIGLLPIEYSQAGPLLCVKRRIADVNTRVYKSGNYSLEAKDVPSTKTTISCMFYGVQDYGQAPVMYTGNDSHNFISYTSPTNALVVESELPFPLNLLAVAVDYVFENRR